MQKKSILFFRNFVQHSGGHQKVFDYFCHLHASEGYAPHISFSDSSLQDKANPWFPDHAGVDFDPTAYDYLFLAGMDWKMLAKDNVNPDQPVINLIQHVRHGLPSEDVYPFLAHRAIRICVSSEVQMAIEDKSNGPVFTIANGIHIPVTITKKSEDVFIAGYKNQALARDLANELGISAQIDQLPREEFLEKLAAARIAVLLPHQTEGFFLPALEAMQLSDIVVVPDCVGNRSFCTDHLQAHGNCLMPRYDRGGILDSIARAKAILADQEHSRRIKMAATKTVNQHSLNRERAEFLNLMSRIDDLWHDK